MIIDGQKNYKKIRVQKPFMNNHVMHQSNYNPTTKIFGKCFTTLLYILVLAGLSDNTWKQGVLPILVHILAFNCNKSFVGWGEDFCTGRIQVSLVLDSFSFSYLIPEHWVNHIPILLCLFPVYGKTYWGIPSGIPSFKCIVIGYEVERCDRWMYPHSHSITVLFLVLFNPNSNIRFPSSHFIQLMN